MRYSGTKTVATLREEDEKWQKRSIKRRAEIASSGRTWDVDDRLMRTRSPNESEGLEYLRLRVWIQLDVGANILSEIRKESVRVCRVELLQ